jgi:GT2 family glycosyltransferase
MPVFTANSPAGMLEMKQYLLSYVIITYNDAGRLPKAISSAALAAAGSGWDYEILVVDNGSRDITTEVLSAFQGTLGQRLRVFKLARNAGTTVSRNLAFRAVKGDLICVMDSDAEILDHDLRPVAELLQEMPEVGIVGPRILLPGGRIYDSAKLLPTLGDKLLKLPGVLLRRPTVNHDWYPDFPFERITCVHTAISCCWFFRPDLIERLGLLDERIFYAPEDVDYCLRAWRAGRAVVYYPHLSVLHHTRQTTHRHPFSPTALSHLRGLIYYLGKHGYWFNRDKVAAQWIDPLAYALQPRLREWERRNLDLLKAVG